MRAEQHTTDGMAAAARAIYAAAVRGVQADAAIGRIDWDRLVRRPLAAYRRVVVVGMGKAGLAMAEAVEDRLGPRVAEGCVVVPHGYDRTRPERLNVPRRIDICYGGHPVPDEGSVRAARRILQLARACTAEDLLIVLVSGGGSALCADFEGDVTLAEAQATFRLLLESGADIHAVNTVRKHLSRIAGGRLARAAAPAEVVALSISDVPGDDLSVIASGPTVPDPTTFADAVDVLERRDLWERVPPAVRRHLTAGRRDIRLETPRPGDPLFDAVRTHLIATNADALASAATEAQARGYRVIVAPEPVTGEAREVGGRLAAEARRVPAGEPVCLLWGGETTVTVRGSGSGGRNQEVALGAALALDGCTRRIVFLSGGTDGIDGPTDAAGAWVTADTAAAARARGLDPAAFLAENDAYAFFSEIGTLLRPGPTHTNVMDVMMALVA